MTFSNNRYVNRLLENPKNQGLIIYESYSEIYMEPWPNDMTDPYDVWGNVQDVELF